MKVTVTFDCSPEEARAFLGLPDVTPLHAAWLERAQKLTTEGFSPEEFARLTRAWTGQGAMDAMQAMFWQAAGLPKPSQ